LSQVVCRSAERGAERSGYEPRRARKNAIAPSTTTASAAAPMRSGPIPPPPVFGEGVTCAATVLGEADAVSVAAATGDALALGAAVIPWGVGVSLCAGVGASVVAIVGGAVRTGVGGAVGGAVGCGVDTAWTTIVPCMNAWMAQ
jgi:hypothetical protein